TDAGRRAQGLVLLTSSAADEDSQESDLLGGSYFTHHLASGMLGDADRSRDGKVSLGEAYAYAYERTVADTASTEAGAQHPTFSFDLAGNGDVVLTDVGARRDGLALPAWAPEGAYFLVDARGFVAAEVHKPAGVERRLALAPGRYRVKRRLSDRIRVGEVEVAAGRISALDETSLRDAPFSDDPVKGTGRTRELPPSWRFGLSLGSQAFFDRTARDTLFPSLGLAGFEAQLRDFPRRDWVLGLEAATGRTEGELELPGLPLLRYRHTQTHLASSLTHEWTVGPLVPFVGGRLALLVLGRTFDDATGLPAQAMGTLSPGVVAGVRLQLPWGLSLGARARAHALLYSVDDNRLLGFTELSAMVMYAP
ncbi:MAG: caspase family protein, partial [Myxococcaceae bacterium]|nr:caspase family protein [Myxococcaceae bacterium]MCI0672502.1 caspase family protein [Myxococcaceae bacterium]